MNLKGQLLALKYLKNFNEELQDFKKTILIVLYFF
jgi:hypothetical protein